jgi:FemAB-related protein (PEP-CTERM system-associated)
MPSFTTDNPPTAPATGAPPPLPAEARAVPSVRALAELHARNLRVAPLKLRDRPAWDRYVRQHPAGTYFHQTTWAETVRDAFAHADCARVAWRGGRIVGVLPLMDIASRLGGRMLVSVPYAVAGGVLADDAGAARQLIRSALRHADDCGARLVDFRQEQTGDVALESLSESGWRCHTDDAYVKFARALPEHPDAVSAWLPRKARAAARNGERKHDLTAAFGKNQLRTVWRLYGRSMRRLGSICYPFAFFAGLVERAGDAADVQLVYHGGRAVAGLVSFQFGDTYLPYFAGCDERCRALSINNFLYLAAMRRAVERGCRVFDFGRTRLANRGSYDFKRFHGFTPIPLAYRKWMRAGDQPCGLSPDAGRFRLARRIWPHLPRTLTDALSAQLARHIPG